MFLLYEKYEKTIFESLAAKAGVVAIIFLFLSAHVYGVRTRSEVWSTGEKLWYDVVVKCPKNGRGLMNYGNVLMSRADYKGAEEYFLKAKNEWPYYSYVYVNLGVLYNAQGKAAESEAALLSNSRAAAENPSRPEEPAVPDLSLMICITAEIWVKSGAPSFLFLTQDAKMVALLISVIAARFLKIKLFFILLLFNSKSILELAYGIQNIFDV